jgi:hypothetical protein
MSNAIPLEPPRLADRAYCTRIACTVGSSAKYSCLAAQTVVRGTGIEPATSSVSGKRSPAELTAPGSKNWRWRRESNPCARLCRPLPHHSATPPRGFDATYNPRADDGIRTRDPHLGKVMRYQLRYIRAQRTRSSPGAKHDDSPIERACTTSSVTSGAPLLAAHAARSAETLSRANLRRHSPLGAGPVAQWESVRFTRGRSLVRSQPGPQLSVLVKGGSIRWFCPAGYPSDG